MSKKALPIVTPTPEIPVNERSDFVWIVTGGAFLAWCAGFINVISILSALGSTVSHNTGITSKMAINFTRLHYSAAIYQGGIVLFYLLGSAFIGAFIKKEKFHYSRKYGLFLIFESILLAVATNFYLHDSKWGVIIASFAMGLQNALFTNFSGAVVRTTHVTGLLTDIGIHVGHYIRWRERTKEFWRLKVLIPLFFGFVFGGVLATISYEFIEVYSMYIPAGALGIAGILWTYKRLRSGDVVDLREKLIL